MRHRLMTLLHVLRHPQQKPPVTAELDRRLDRAEARLQKVMTPDAARHARELVRTRG